MAKSHLKLVPPDARRPPILCGVMFDRLYRESLAATGSAPAPVSCEMWRQSRILFQIFPNRAGW